MTKKPFLLRMIKKYKEFVNESVLKHLVGPSKDEVWKEFGYEKSFDTPEEYFNYIYDRLYNFKYDNHIVLSDKKNTIDYNIKNNQVVCKIYEYIDFMTKIFNINHQEATNIIEEILITKLKLNSKVEFDFYNKFGDSQNYDYDSDKIFFDEYYEEI